MKRRAGKSFPVGEAVIDPNGVVGDGHSGNWHRQVSLLSYESIKTFNEKAKNKSTDPGKKNFPFTVPGDFGENITTEGISLEDLKIGDRFYIFSNIEKPIAQGLPASAAVLLEVTQIGKECPAPCSIYRHVGSCIMPQQGIFCKVIKTGKIKNGYIISRGSKQDEG